MSKLIHNGNHVASEFTDGAGRRFYVSSPDGTAFASIEVESGYPSVVARITHIKLPDLIQLRDALSAHIERIEAMQQVAA